MLDQTSSPENAVDVSEGFAEIPGGRLYFRRWTPQLQVSRPYPIILLHDSIGCVDMWRQFPKALALSLRHPVIAYDRLGYGRSSERYDAPVVRFVHEEAEIYFPRLKEHLGIDEFALFGHSVGGGMAVIIASNFSPKCRAVITEAAQAYVEKKTLTSIAEGKKRFADPQELAKLEKFHGAKANWVVRAWTETWLSEKFADWNLRSELLNLTCPLLAIHGDRDEYGSSDFPKVLSSSTSGYAEKLIIRDCGHVPHREHEELVLSETKRFLDKASP
jgi:pimeloyl-ACP methyl ester carboxylesterase